MQKNAKLPENRALKNRIYDNYKKSAIRRGYIFNISIEDFDKLIDSDCFYCGALAKDSSNKMKDSSSKNERFYTYNGVDRVDNTIGYNRENCVPCCPICNMAKRELSFDLFKD